ncbi:hypothetical protein LE181_25920 [Streptomyces sp. SCA3-4]|uniref:hypothetical protein n=1 Tax=Streptomyces sichuanensis TaxID=2871810 RepID=UPI001CE306F9|nr:hypothetical protein [Streptomyces sichuanensis]MCA6095587.1 hypothetical protein [Streptomyces sichuanensis]
MLAPNDAVITRVITTTHDGDVATCRPNICCHGPVAKFKVCVEIIAGNYIGNSCLPYTLSLHCIDECLAEPNKDMSRLGQIQHFSKNDGWKLNGCKGTYVRWVCFTIDVPPKLPGCHVFHYVVTLCDKRGTIASFRHSAPFILGAHENTEC